MKKLFLLFIMLASAAALKPMATPEDQESFRVTNGFNGLDVAIAPVGGYRMFVESEKQPDKLRLVFGQLTIEPGKTVRIFYDRGPKGTVRSSESLAKDGFVAKIQAGDEKMSASFPDIESGAEYIIASYFGVRKAQ